MVSPPSPPLGTGRQGRPVRAAGRRWPHRSRLRLAELPADVPRDRARLVRRRRTADTVRRERNCYRYLCVILIFIRILIFFFFPFSFLFFFFLDGFFIMRPCSAGFVHRWTSDTVLCLIHRFPNPPAQSTLHDLRECVRRHV
jgi:hypothetical protein